MGRTDEQGEGSRTVVDELSEILGHGFLDESTASQTWEAQDQAEEKSLANEEERYVYEEEAATYEEEQRLTAQALADGRGY